MSSKLGSGHMRLVDTVTKTGRTLAAVFDGPLLAQSRHSPLHRTCPLLTQSGHWLPSRGAKRHISGMGIRRAVSWAAIYAIALQTILSGILPPTNSPSVAGDTFSVICRTDTQSLSSIDQIPGGDGHLAGHGCDHCILCNASVSPLPPDTLLGIVFLPVSVAHVFRPALSAPTADFASNPKLARGPPQSS